MRINARSGSMRLSRLCVALCLLLLWNIAAPASGESEDKVPVQSLYPCVQVIDGDSVIVQSDGLYASVRLVGIDCPEMNQEWGDAAKDFTASHVLGKDVRLEFDHPRQDDYHRNLCYLWYHAGEGWVCLNLELVRAGLAVPYRSHASLRLQPDILAAQDEAKRTRQGFWAQGGLKLHPREHRRQHRR